MFKVYFNYGCMTSGKTADLLITAHNNKEKGVPAYILSPKTDTRSGKGVISTRIGLTAKADMVIDKFNQPLAALVDRAIKGDGIIIIDEAQFVSPSTVHGLCNYCRDQVYKNSLHLNNFCILAYGLLTDFRSSLFKGTVAWLDEADSINKIKIHCAYCSYQATHNLLLTPEKAEGNIMVGDSEYKPVCSYHYWKYTRGNKDEEVKY